MRGVGEFAGCQSGAGGPRQERWPAAQAELALNTPQPALETAWLTVQTFPLAQHVLDVTRHHRVHLHAAGTARRAGAGCDQLGGGPPSPPPTSLAARGAGHALAADAVAAASTQPHQAACHAPGPLADPPVQPLASAMSWFSLLMLRVVRLSRYSFLVFWMKVSARRHHRRRHDQSSMSPCDWRGLAGTHGRARHRRHPDPWAAQLQPVRPLLCPSRPLPRRAPPRGAAHQT